MPSSTDARLGPAWGSESSPPVPVTPSARNTAAGPARWCTSQACLECSRASWSCRRGSKCRFSSSRSAEVRGLRCVWLPVPRRSAANRSNARLSTKLMVRVASRTAPANMACGMQIPETTARAKAWRDAACVLHCDMQKAEQLERNSKALVRRLCAGCTVMCHTYQRRLGRRGPHALAFGSWGCIRGL